MATAGFTGRSLISSLSARGGQGTMATAGFTGRSLISLLSARGGQGTMATAGITGRSLISLLSARGGQGTMATAGFTGRSLLSLRAVNKDAVNKEHGHNRNRREERRPSRFRRPSNPSHRPLSTESIGFERRGVRRVLALRCSSPCPRGSAACLMPPSRRRCGRPTVRYRHGPLQRHCSPTRTPFHPPPPLRTRWRRWNDPHRTGGAERSRVTRWVGRAPSDP
jgi:hypothetical protein